MSKDLFENITDDEAATLDWVLHNQGAFPADYFFEDPTVDGRIEELEAYGLVTLDVTGKLSITELGRAALKEHTQLLEKRTQLENQRMEELSSMKSLASSAQLHADSAIKEVLILREQLELHKEQVELISSIAVDAKSNAVAAIKEVTILQNQLRLAENVANDSNHEVKLQPPHQTQPLRLHHLSLF